MSFQKTFSLITLNLCLFHQIWTLFKFLGPVCIYSTSFISLTDWGRVTHICVDNLIIIGSDDGLSPGQRQAIAWTNVGILLIGPLGTKFGEIFIEILRVSFKKMRSNGSSAKWRPFCLGLNVLILSVCSVLTGSIVMKYLIYQFIKLITSYAFYSCIFLIWN